LQHQRLQPETEQNKAIKEDKDLEEKDRLRKGIRTLVMLKYKTYPLNTYLESGEL
jgi:hypothetical protein